MRALSRPHALESGTVTKYAVLRSLSFLHRVRRDGNFYKAFGDEAFDLAVSVPVSLDPFTFNSRVA